MPLFEQSRELHVFQTIPNNSEQISKQTDKTTRLRYCFYGPLHSDSWLNWWTGSKWNRPFRNFEQKTKGSATHSGSHGDHRKSYYNRIIMATMAILLRSNKLRLEHHLSHRNPDLTSDMEQNPVHYPIVLIVCSVVVVSLTLCVSLHWP